MAPELLQAAKLPEENTGKAADIWAMGCLMYEICSLNFLWESEFVLGMEAKNNPRFVNQFLRDTFPHCYSKKLKGLVKHMLHPCKYSRYIRLQSRFKSKAHYSGFN